MLTLAETVCGPVKLPTGVPDADGLLVTATEGLPAAVKLCRGLGDAWDEGVSDCVELLDPEGEPVGLLNEEYVTLTLELEDMDTVIIELKELVVEAVAPVLNVFAEADFSGLGLGVKVPLRVPVRVEEAQPDKEPVSLTDRDMIELLDAVAAVELLLEFEGDAV